MVVVRYGTNYELRVTNYLNWRRRMEDAGLLMFVVEDGVVGLGGQNCGKKVSIGSNIPVDVRI